jgi:hypothetical protein
MVCVPFPPSRHTDIAPLVVGNTHVDRSAIDIQQLFEDREFENQLLNFLTQRMDPGRLPGSPQQSEHPPSYRPTPVP